MILLFQLLLLIVSFLEYGFAQNFRGEECATFDGGINMCDYESHDEMVRKLMSLATR